VEANNHAGSHNLDAIAVSMDLIVIQATIDQQSLHSFLQLRVDYKTQVMPYFAK
jgi:hypothetical protein